MTARIGAFLTATAILLISGVVSHLMARDTEQLESAAARVAAAPRTVGDWQARDEATDDAVFEQIGARGYWTRTYVNQKTKESVLVILMCGRPGKMAVHTPEICYSGAGYDLSDQPTTVAIADGAAGESDDFWNAQFTKKGPRTTHLRLCWAWNAQGTWEASPSPRWQFRGEPFLYKLYVSRDVSSQSGLAIQADPVADFLRQFLPPLRATLFPPRGT